MLPPVCFSCGKLFADIAIPYENNLEKIDNDSELNSKEKSDKKAQLLDKYCINNYCCRTRLLGYVRLVDIIV